MTVFSPDKVRTMDALASSTGTFFQDLATAWKANDGAAVADLFTEDESLINPFGERGDGTAALSTMYGEYFRGMLHGTTTLVQVTNLRPWNLSTSWLTHIRRYMRLLAG